MHSLTGTDIAMYVVCGATMAIGFACILLGVRLMNDYPIEKATGPTRPESEPTALPDGSREVVLSVAADGTPVVVIVRPMSKAERDYLERSYDHNPEQWRERRLDG